MKIKTMLLLSVFGMVSVLNAAETRYATFQDTGTIGDVRPHQKQTLIFYSEQGNQKAFGDELDSIARQHDIEPKGKLLALTDSEGKNLLRIAVRNQYQKLVADMVKLLETLSNAEKAAILNAKVNDMTTLSSAIHKGNPTIVYQLLQAGANPNITFDDGVTHLSQAVILQEPVIVALLLKYGADVDQADKNKIKPLIHAIKSENKDIIALINYELPPIAWNTTQDPVTGQTAVALAQQRGVKVMKGRATQSPQSYLQEKMGIPIKEPTLAKKNFEQLFQAIQRDDVSAIENILFSYEDITNVYKLLQQKDRQDNNALNFAVVNDKTNSARYLLDFIKKGLSPSIVTGIFNVYNKEGLSPLLYALKNSNYELAQKLIGAGANVNQRMPDQYRTPLLVFFVKQNKVPQVRWLLSRDADPTISGQYNALVAAIENNHEQLVSLILKSAKPKQKRELLKSKSDGTYIPLSYAYMIDKDEGLANTLLSDMKEVFSSDELSSILSRNTGTYFILLDKLLASDTNKEKYKQFYLDFINAGADPNADLGSGNTPLMHVVDRLTDPDQFWIVEFLVNQAEVNINARNNWGDTALSLARENKHLDPSDGATLIAILESLGAQYGQRRR